jgi:hypothetical protein
VGLYAAIPGLDARAARNAAAEHPDTAETPRPAAAAATALPIGRVNDLPAPSFQSTQPHNGLPRRRVGDRLRVAAERGSRRDVDAGITHLASLNPSLLQDLQRFAQSHRPGEGLDLLEVLAASLRHNSALLLHLQDDEQVLQMQVLPASRQLRCELARAPWQALGLLTLRVLRVGTLDLSGSTAPPPWGMAYDLGPMLWHLALHGARGELLPEIGGVATYRVTPGASLDVAEPVGALATAVQRLQGQTTPLREIASWPGFDRDRAERLLNALYLQSALIVTRSHPGALSGI